MLVTMKLIILQLRRAQQVQVPSFFEVSQFSFPLEQVTSEVYCPFNKPCLCFRVVCLFISHAKYRRPQQTSIKKALLQHTTMRTAHTAFLVLFILTCLGTGCSGGGQSRFTSIISFGDSYTDTGNLVRWADPALPPQPINNLPNGETFFGHPTGWVSNGRIVLDFIADALGLPFVPPYLAKEKTNFSAGVNFAVAGAPALNLTYLQGQNMTVKPPIKSSLDDQLVWFEKLKPSLCRGQGANCFGSTLFVMGEFGANDHVSFLISNRTLEQARAYVPRIVDSISRGVEGLIQHGAKYIVVADIFPFGCQPAVLTFLASTDKADYDRNGCLRSVNRLLPQYHNSLLRQRIKVLRDTYPQTTIISTEYYRPIIAFLHKPGHFGLNISTTLLTCCGAGGPPYNFDFSTGCGQPGVMACAHPSEALQWDGSHLTEAAHRLIADGWLHGPYADPPILQVAR